MVPAMETTTTTATTSPLMSGWSSHPIPNFSLSASGLIVLADLSTIAQRTVLRGGSSWLDSLLLAPGMHYQQAADDLVRGDNAQILTAVEVDRNGRPTAHRIVNQAVVSYVLRIAKEGRTVVLDVGEVSEKKSSWGLRRRGRGGQRAMLYGGPDNVKEGLSWAAHLLYVASPLLTCLAIIFVVLLKDWWALAIIGLLMTSRILNITVIKSRSKPKPPHLPSPFSLPASAPPPPRITQYTITLNPTTTVVLRGLSPDLYALTTTVWLRPKTHLEGYLEATAKMLVYSVAAISGNATQAGNIVMLSLLVVSAGLLALSNGRQRGLLNGGRVVAPYPGDHKNEYSQTRPGADRRDHGGGNGGGDDDDVEQGRVANGREETDSWPGTSDSSSVDEPREKSRVGGVTGTSFPSDDSVECEVRLETRAGTVQVTALRD